MSGEPDVLVGLEVHQQLDTGRKLFCACAPSESESGGVMLTRALRPTSGEAGGYDPAALFEASKSQRIEYRAGAGAVCDLELDEMPPRALDAAAKESALLIAAALDAEPVCELLPMRKLVVDGSNTSGFQRTMLVATGGELRFGGRSVGVQSICLEEDAARLIGSSDGVRSYDLGRLGVPLVEIALEPARVTPREARSMALALGRLLRATRRVRRGLGTIRQDVNVSVMGGSVVEVKGVQHLDALEKVVEYETERQRALAQLASSPQVSSMRDLGDDDIADVTEIVGKTASPVLRRALERGERVMCVRARSLAGAFSHEPRAGFRLGREIGQAVRFFGAGGVLHSDELPGHGIGDDETDRLRSHMGLRDGDAFVLAAAAPAAAQYAAGAIVARINAARGGAPAETRAATRDGQTAYLRPRPGASRMYPETDVPPVRVSAAELERAAASVPPTWDESVARLGSEHGLNAQLAEQVLSSERAELFERIAAYPNVGANFAASALVSTLPSLRKRGAGKAPLPDAEIDAAFAMLSRGEIAKESIERIFEAIMSGECATAADAAAGAAQIDDGELRRRISAIVADAAASSGDPSSLSAGYFMGEIMRKLRGRAPGEKISRMLSEEMRAAGLGRKQR